MEGSHDDYAQTVQFLRESSSVYPSVAGDDIDFHNSASALHIFEVGKFWVRAIESDYSPGRIDRRVSSYFHRNLHLGTER